MEEVKKLCHDCEKEIEVEGEVVDKFEILFKPLPGKEIHLEALEVNGRTPEELLKFPHPSIGLRALKTRLSRYVDKYNPSDKMIVAGYNVAFDADFLRQLYLSLGDKYYGSWFFSPMLDVYTYVAEAVAKKKLRLPNYKLVTVCKAFNIEAEGAHDAKVDIEITRQLYYKLKEYLL